MGPLLCITILMWDLITSLYFLVFLVLNVLFRDHRVQSLTLTSSLEGEYNLLIVILTFKIHNALRLVSFAFISSSVLSIWGTDNISLLSLCDPMNLSSQFL